jgi:hypothetical protein|uniref:Uncharacterized protein n=1 Tax=Sipha flava TaxID=143950 RepID=A0A2S2QVZ9_9HEMI
MMRYKSKTMLRAKCITTCILKLFHQCKPETVGKITRVYTVKTFSLINRAAQRYIFVTLTAAISNVKGDSYDSWHCARIIMLRVAFDCAARSRYFLTHLHVSSA